MMKKKSTAKGGGIGYIVLGTLVVIAALFCLLVITGSLAPLILRMHAGDAPAMMTMPLFPYCVFADFILLEAIFLLFQPGVKRFMTDEKQPAPDEKKKKLSSRYVVAIVCCVLLLCSIILAPGVCNVMTEQGVDTYVLFVNTGSYAWEDVPLYELSFSQQNGLELHLYLSKDNKIPMFGAVNSVNNALTEKYGSIYGFACYLKELAMENDWSFKVQNRESIEYYFKDSAYWEYIEKLIQ